MAHVVGDAARIPERHAHERVPAVGRRTDLETLVQKGHDLQPLDDRASNEDRTFGQEDSGIGPKRDGGTGATVRRLADHREG